MDVALYVSLVHGQTASFDNAIEWGSVLQTDVGRVQLNANVFFERTFGARRPAPTQMKYQWQAKVRWLPAWQFGAQGFGAQGFGKLGAWDQWAPQRRQSHRIGPVVFATPELTGREELSIQAAYLGGKTYGTQGHMFSFRWRTASERRGGLRTAGDLSRCFRDEVVRSAQPQYDAG